jgi:polynucleotide 5'-hydroxyl-kinase GRC3/NOL9
VKQSIEKDKTLLVDGPARVDLLSGRASVLGALIKAEENIVVRKGKRIPLQFLCNSEVELVLGDSASYAETDGDSIPSSWGDAVNEIQSTKEPKIVLVLGGVDSGKTSFCTYLTNTGLKNKYKVALIDGDLGQSDLGPPGTVSLSLAKELVVDLFKLRSEDLVFIGVTSPSKKVEAILNALGALKEEALEREANLLIINTDGWVDGDGVVSYKLRLVKAVAPDFVVAIQGEDELAPILAALRDVNVLAIDSPQNVKKRNRETRKLLRESAYRKYLKDAKVRSFPLSWVKIEGDVGLNTERGSQLERKNEEARDDVLDLEKPNLEDEENKKIGSESGKKAIELHYGEEEGILVSLEDADGKILGMGTICNVDHYKGVIKISTPVDEAVSKIRLGQIKLDNEGNEIGLVSGSI